MSISKTKFTATIFALSASLATNAMAEEVGSVDTAFKFFGPDHSIRVEAFDDPQVEGVTCYVSRAITGGISGGLGLAENTSDASIACRKTGKIALRGELEDGDEVFSQRSSIMFKELHVVRFYDEDRATLVYLTYSDKLIDGSPKNSISAVVIGDDFNQ